eukprot:gene15768-21891_t
MDVDTPSDVARRQAEAHPSSGRTVSMMATSAHGTSRRGHSVSPMMMSSPRNTMNTGSSGRASLMSFADMLSVNRMSVMRNPPHPGGSEGKDGGPGFSFAKGLLKPSSRVLYNQLQHQESSTPDLFQKTHSHRPDEVSPADAAPPPSAELTTLDFTKPSTPADIEAAVLALTESQQQSVQRLMCSPQMLSSSPRVFDTLSRLPNLSFLILGIEGGESSAAASGQAEDTWPNLEPLMECLKNLVCLDVSNCGMQDAHLQAIARSCKGLRALDVSYSPQVSTAGLVEFLKTCTSLEELDASACPQATSDELMSAIAGNCPLLTSLYLEYDAEWVKTVSSEEAARPPAGAVLSQAGLIVLAQGCTKLQMFNLAGQQVAPSDTKSSSGAAGNTAQEPQPPAPKAAQVAGDSEDELDDDDDPTNDGGLTGLTAIAMYCQELVILDLAGCEWLTDEGLVSLSQGLKDLASLQLSGCHQLTSASLSRLHTLFPKLSTDGEAGDDQQAPQCASPSEIKDSLAPLSDISNMGPAVADVGGSGKQGAGEAGAGGQWTGLMSFLSTRTSEVMLNSCKRPTRPHRDRGY